MKRRRNRDGRPNDCENGRDFEIRRRCDAVFVLGHAFDFKIDGRGSGGNSSTTDRELVTLCSEFLNSGMNTTKTVIEWGMAELIANEEVQRKIVEENK
ncbi:cytochrome P450 77A3-like [Cucumis melo var. makuwa]|uniref:Cytochrome P450 77A3-like n=1 Tax=Cucumis melo var. makuwa TaxID=1194695 RepID=A0A5A7SWM2_CUCMM|nr:cytochrome P450 77A3-like [Cucumis melo var. makuwa]TYJ95628.1 cytochrome P450 77A3-like [Cucumis melo var. makuwa]